MSIHTFDSLNSKVVTHLAFLGLATMSGGLLYAQAPPIPSGATLYASGLQGPRGLAFGPDGLLYVAEAGTGGTTSTASLCTQVVAPVGPYTGGSTGRVSSVAPDGTVTTVAGGFPSTVDAMGDQIGVAGVAFIGTSLYALVAGGGCSHGNLMAPNGVYLVNPASHNAKVVADLSAFVRANPVRHPNAADFEPDDVPYSMIASGDRLYVVEPNHGQLLEVTIYGGVRQVADLSAPLGHIVPTSVLFQNDQFWIGNLGLFPITTATEKVYQVSPRGCVLDFVDGFTSITGMAADGLGNIYVLEFSAADGLPAAGNGRVVRVTGDSSEVVISGLSVPTGITVGPDGALYISDLGAAPAPAGRILRVVPPPAGQGSSLTTSFLAPSMSSGDRSTLAQRGCALPAAQSGAAQ